MEKSIPFNSLKQHDSADLGANTNNKSYMKGPWNHLSSNSSRVSGATSEPYGSDDKGYANLNGIILWPSRLYVCNFCKREFRSAQALGGHMNVHRRDRARLRQSPPSPQPAASFPKELVMGMPSSPQPAASFPKELVMGVRQQSVAASGSSLDLNLMSSPNPRLISSSSWMIHQPDQTTISTSSSFTVPSMNSSSPFRIPSPSSASANELKRSTIANRAYPFINSVETAPTNLCDTSKDHHDHISELIFNGVLNQEGLVRLGMGIGSLRKEDVDLELRLGFSS